MKSRNQAAPTGKAVEERDHGRVARPPPGLDVQLHRAGPGVRLALLPVVRVMEHVAQEPHVLRPAAPDDDRHGSA